MKRIISIVVTACALTLGQAAMAETVAGVGFARLSDGDIGLSAIEATIGWKMETASGFAIIPELRLGTGVGDDQIATGAALADVELSSALGFNLRTEWSFENTYVFLQPSYVNYEVEVSALGFTAAADDWEFGVGAGIGYKMTDWTSIEISYEDIGGTSLIGASIRFEFN